MNQETKDGDKIQTYHYYKQWSNFIETAYSNEIKL